MKIAKIDRYGSCTNDYVYYVHYENGDIEQYGGKLPKEISKVMAQFDMQFMQNKRGEYFHRFARDIAGGYLVKE